MSKKLPTTRLSKRINGKRVCYTLFILFVFNSSNLNAQIFNWAKSIGNANFPESCYEIESDAYGNTYSTGSFRGTTDFDPGPGVYNLTSIGTDMFILKLDPAGNFVWAKSIGGNLTGTNAAGRGITLDAFNNVYIFGYATYNSVVDYDPGPGVYTLTDGTMPLIKLDTAGNFIWARYISDSYNGACGSITVDNSGNIYTVGSFKGVADFNPDSLLVYNLTVPGSASNGYISKLDSAGNFIWAKQLVSPNSSALSGCLDIKLDAAQNPVICGSFSDTTDFDPGLGVTKIGTVGLVGLVDAYILKLDSSGSFLWVRTIGGNLNDYAESLACDAQDNIYISGRFNNQVDFDPGPAIFNLTPAGSASNVFILKLDNNGIFKWAKNVEGNINLNGFGIALDASANIFVCGLLQGSADFDPGPAVFNLTTAGNDDAFVLKLDSSGNFLGAKRIGGTGTEKCYSITVDAGGNCYTAGSYEVTANFDSPASSLLTSAGSADTFIAKYGVFGVGISENISGMDATLYPNPTKGAFEINLGQHFSFLEIIIHDILGKEISRTKYSDVSRLKAIIPGESGMYFVKIICPESSNTLKIIKE